MVTNFKKINFLIITLFLSACSFTNNSSENSQSNNLGTGTIEKNLIVYSSVEDIENENILAYWANKNNVKLKVVHLTSNEIDLRLEKEKNNPIADLRFGDMNLKRLSGREHLYQIYKAEDDEKNDKFENLTGYVTNYKLVGNSFVVNTILERELGIQISGYEDLIDVRLSKYISMGYATISDQAFYQLANLLQVVGDGSYLDEKSWDFLEKIVKNTKGSVVGAFFDVHIVVMSSEAIVGLTNEINSTLLIQQGVGRVRTVYPKEGTVFKPVGSSIIKNSSNNLVAQEFLDWLVSSEGQQQVSKSMLRPVNKSILLENKNFLPINNIKVVEENEQLLYESKEEIISRFEVLLKKYS